MMLCCWCGDPRPEIELGEDGMHAELTDVQRLPLEEGRVTKTTAAPDSEEDEEDREERILEKLSRERQLLSEQRKSSAEVESTPQRPKEGEQNLRPTSIANCAVAPPDSAVAEQQQTLARERKEKIQQLLLKERHILEGRRNDSSESSCPENLVRVSLDCAVSKEDSVNGNIRDLVDSPEEDGLCQGALGMSTAELATLVNRLDTIASRLEKVANLQNSTPEENNLEMALSPSVVAYDHLVNGPLQKFLSLSGIVGNEVKTQSDMVNAAFHAQRKFLVIASKAKEPPQNILISLLKPTSDQIQNIQDFREKNRVSSFFNHLSAISESISALGWVTVSPAPAPFVKDMLDAGQFYTNRVLVDYKEKDKNHTEWVRAWLQVLNDLQAYVKQYHTTGLEWNQQGCDATGISSSTPAPPPPPPPPPADYFTGPGGDTSENDARAALFRDINQGSDITKGLKRITSEQQTHKNPDLRLQTAPPYKAPVTAPRPFKPVVLTQFKPTKPPMFELEGKKWRVEYQSGNKGLVISDTGMNQSVHLFQCIDSMVVVKGKINSITIDSCKKTAIVFDDIVSFVEFINCQSCQAQSMGKVPTITIDKTDGAQIYLSMQSLSVEIITSKSSEVNVSVPQANGDYVEIPVPEQLKTVVSGKGLKTEVVEKN